MTEKKEKGISDDLTSPNIVLDKIIEQALTDEKQAKALREQGINGNIFILLDFHNFLEGPDVERRLKTFANIESMTSIIMTGPSLVTTPAVEDIISVLDFPYPNNKEIEKSIDTLIEATQKQGKLPNLAKETMNKKDELVKAANGLTLHEAQMAFAKSIVQHKTFDIPTILKEKEQIIRKKGLLEFFPPRYSMDDIGGLKNLTSWLKLRKSAFHSDASVYGLPSPKGVLLIGPPGTGKSLCAKAASALFEIPLLKLDFGRLFGSLVGESEKAARDVLKLAEQVSPAVLWFDEVEKGISGMKSSGQTDGGTTSRVIGTLLTWMQEKTAPVFVFATANDYSQIPPEFMRRFDETFFLNLPTVGERRDIFKVLLKKYKRNPENFNLNLMALKTENYSGAEIEKVIVSALFEGFSNEKREITNQDLLNAITVFKPLFYARQEELEAMKMWGQERCIIANTNEPLDDTSSGGVAIDLS